MRDRQQANLGIFAHRLCKTVHEGFHSETNATTLRMQEIERKYRKPVNANGWMRKLQRWAWGKATPKFVGYCPFFWFTWLTLLLSPVVLVVKTVGFIFRFIGSAIPESLSTRKPSDDLIVEFYAAYLRFGLEEIKEWAEFDDVYEWIVVTPDWENCAKAILAKRAKKAEKRAVAEPKQARWAKRLARYSGLIVKTFLSGAVIAVLYLSARPIWRGIIFLCHFFGSLSWSDLLWMAKVGGVAVLIVCGLWALVGILARIIEGLRICPKCPDKIGLSYRLGLVVRSGVEFFFETIAALYTRECPLIEWDDHNEPIQRRN